MDYEFSTFSFNYNKVDFVMESVVSDIKAWLTSGIFSVGGISSFRITQTKFKKARVHITAALNYLTWCIGAAIKQNSIINFFDEWNTLIPWG